MLPADFRLYFPEFSANSDGQIQFWLDRSVTYFNVCMWADMLNDGIANWVAHQLSLQNIRTTVNATTGQYAAQTNDNVTMKKLGDAVVQKSEAAVLIGIKDPMTKTSYGQEYLRLVNLLGSAIAV